MTITSEIQRIKNNIADAFDAAEAKGATMPVTENSDNLATTIETITGGSGGEQVEAVNNTGSAITNGDKVWINQENSEKSLVNYYKEGKGFSNFDVYGQLTFDSEKNVVSNFSASNYIKLQKLFNPGNNSWEIVLKVKFGSRDSFFFGNTSNKFGIVVGRYGTANGGRLTLFLSSNNSNWNIASNIGDLVLEDNTEYYIKLSYDLTSYKLEASADGIVWQTSTSIISSEKIYPNELYIGSSWVEVTGFYHDGSIDLSETYIKINGEIWWQSYEQGIQKQLSRDILVIYPSRSDYFLTNSGIYKSFIYTKTAYPYINKVFKPGNNTWKLITKIKTPSDDQINNYNVIFCGQNDFFNTGFEIALNEQTHKLQFGVGDGSNWTIAYIFGTKVFDADTVYWLKFEFNGSRYSLSYSLDGENYVEDCYVDSTTAIGNSGNSLISIGYRDSTRYWRGEIDLSETNIEVNGKLWNDASVAATNITSDTQTGSAAESIASGSTGLVNVGAVIEPTGSITITTNGTHDVTDYAEAVVNVPVPAGDKYKVGDIVKDDNNTAIGTISGFKTDANNVSYAVCCLNGVYRGNGDYYSSDILISTLPAYSNLTVFANKETATYNTQKILDYASSHNGSSSACNLCRASSFVIDGVTYYGQLPTIDELIDIFKNRTVINSQDTSGSNPLPTSQYTWSSTQYDNLSGWEISDTANVNAYYKSRRYCFIIPVLEIPLED